MKIFQDFDLTNYNSYRLKSICRTAFFPETETELTELLSQKRDCILIGSGHNIILSEEYYNSGFIILNGNFAQYKIDYIKGILEADAGCFMQHLSEYALDNGLSGLEIFYDIPSSFGGAVVMNAGASGEEIKDLLIKVRYLDMQDMQIKEIEKEEIGFEYRNSFFQKNKDKIVLKGWLQLVKKEASEIKKKMETVKAARWAKQPKELPNAGSVFKRPPGYYVGAIMDDLNLKGFAIGGAKISEKHGGFIVNYDNATGQDILNIIKEVKKRVTEKYKIDLEIEQRII